MTLRLRLVIALLVLVTLGLVVFGVVTYSLYSHSQYQRLDDQLRASLPAVGFQVREAAGLEQAPGLSREPSGGDGDRQPQPSVVVPPGTYAELRDSAGKVVGAVQLSDTSEKPRLTGDLVATGAERRLFTTGSRKGSDRWRVYVAPADHPTGYTIVIAEPLKEVNESLRRLVLIEVASGAGLLAILGVGAWLILRRGLRPLERMATSAGSITAGDLSQRVPTAASGSEVGQLGLALNAMLAEIEEAFREREATEARLRQFLADASHELRTPLTSIQGFSELFRLGADQDREALAVALRRIEEDTERMKTLVEDLLLLARLDETRPVERESVDLAVLAADACGAAAAIAPDRQITLDAPEPVVVPGDDDHLRQALANLVTNAVRHTPDGSPIEVSATADDGYGTVVVRDHGAGLDEEALTHMFDRFWRADQARAGTGTGLGLSIVAGIADEHGGTATAENDAGGGARFTLRLPRSPDPNRTPG